MDFWKLVEFGDWDLWIEDLRMLLNCYFVFWGESGCFILEKILGDGRNEILGILRIIELEVWSFW